ncbi:hypothetical protein F4780DRAFT_737500 [Xylariomycetidae sp. FL0641]|nr:hypothetical protein F4780DRAFT_737500 [Xylariomycetidae sp. FL0641]
MVLMVILSASLHDSTTLHSSMGSPGTRTTEPTLPSWGPVRLRHVRNACPAAGDHTIATHPQCYHLLLCRPGYLA